MSNDWFYCFSSLTFKFIANSLIVLLAPTRYLSISIHLSFYYSIYLAFLSLVVRKNELEQQMLMNLNKKSWSDGLTLRDYKDHCGLNQVRTICTIYIKKIKKLIQIQFQSHRSSQSGSRSKSDTMSKFWARSKSKNACLLFFLSEFFLLFWRSKNVFGFIDVLSTDPELSMDLLDS